MNIFKKFILGNKYIVIIAIFYLTIFFLMQGKILFTPDYGESDAYHFNLSMKYYLSESLKAGKFPFWTDDIQGGYPLISEGQIGAFFIPNILLLTTLPFPSAYNLLFIFTLFTLTLGTYLLLNTLKINKLLAFLIGLNFAFNGTVILRMVHLNLIQAFSLIPLLFYTYIKLVKTRKKRFMVLFVFIFPQMIFAGYVPVVFMAILGLCFFHLIFIFNKFHWRAFLVQYAFLAALCLFGLLLALPQLLPSSLLTNSSSRQLDIPFNTVTAYPLQIKNLLGFLNPFAFGNPKLGTYPPLSSDWGIFWENTPYIGWILSILIVIGTAIILRERKLTDKKTLLKAFLTFTIFILIALGKNSPVYFIFYYPPFNFFRTQSRYLMMATLFIFIYSAFLLNKLYMKNAFLKLCIVILLLINLVDLLAFTKNYHLFIDAPKVLAQPESAKAIDSRYLYLTLTQPEEWNDEFLKKGWHTKESVEKYLFYKSYLFPNSNLLFDKRVYGINSFGLGLRRHDYMRDLILHTIPVQDSKTLTLTQESYNLMKFMNIKYLIVNKRVQSNSTKVDSKHLTHGGKNIYIHSLNTSMRPYYSPHMLSRATYVEDFENQLLQKKDFQANAIVEEQDIAKGNLSEVKISNYHDSESKVTTHVNSQGRGMVVFKKNYYPEWRAFIDGKQVPIYKTNLVHLGIFVPKGSHAIELKYENNEFKKGLAGGLLALLVFSVLFLRFNLEFLKWPKR